MPSIGGVLARALYDEGEGVRASSGYQKPGL